MAIGRIGTYAIFQSTLKDMGNTQNQLINLQMQLSSGLKAQDYAGISSQAEQFLDIEKKITQSDTYLKNNKLVDARLQITSSALDRIIEAATTLKNIISTRRSGVQGTLNAFAEQLTDQWQTISAQLNISSEGRYLFSGTATDVKPVDTTALPELTSLGVPDDGYYQGSKENIVIRAHEEISFEYNVRADNSAFQKIFAGISMGKYGDTNNDDDALARAYDLVEGGLKDVITLQATVNSNKVAIDDINTQHQSLKLYWQGLKEEIVNTDLVSVSTQVAINQGILQASFQAFARINSLRLSDFL